MAKANCAGAEGVEEGGQWLRALAGREIALLFRLKAEATDVSLTDQKVIRKPTCIDRGSSATTDLRKSALRRFPIGLSKFTRFVAL